MGGYYTMRVPVSEQDARAGRTAVAPKRSGGARQLGATKRDAVLIANPRAGSGRRSHQLDEARRMLASAGIETELQSTGAPGHAADLAREAVEANRSLVIICGGDGTINEAVNGLAGSQVALAVLPAGTANVLAKELSLPWNLPRAAARIARAEPRRIALGLAVPEPSSGPSRYFLSVAGAGVDGALVHALDPEEKLHTGIFAYWLEGMRQLRRYNFPRFRVSTSAKELEATLVVVGRTKHYGGPFRITTEANLARPEFELCAVTTRKALRFIGLLPKLWTGSIRRDADVRFWKTTSLTCTPVDEGPIYIQVDGEPAGRLPAEFRIVPDALTLLMPSQSASAGRD